MAADLRPAAGPAAAAAPRLSVAELLTWVALFFCGALVAWVLPQLRTAGAGWTAFNMVELIAWGCALVLAWGEPVRRPARRGLAIATPLLLLVAVVVPGRLSAVPLLGFGCLLALGGRPSDREVRAGAIVVAIAVRNLAAGLIPLLFGDLILRGDTVIAGLVMRAVIPGSTWTSTSIRPPHGIGVTVEIGCSSLANLSLVCLCFVSLLKLDSGRLGRRELATLAGICLVVVAFNTARLIATARSVEGYTYWHDGAGATLFGVALTGLTILLCSGAARRLTR